MAKRGRTTFDLYDLELVVERIDGQCTCRMRIGDRVFLRGGKISLPAGADFCLYALQAAIPLMPAKQRRNHPADWMETDTRVTCPDPACRLIMRIDRAGRRVLDHDDVSAVALAADRASTTKSPRAVTGRARAATPRSSRRRAPGA